MRRSPREASLNRPGRLLAAALLLGAVPLEAARAAEVVRVTIDVPVPARLDMAGIDRVLVTSLIVEEEVGNLDLGKELVILLRKELQKRTRLEILDVEPPPLPEQPLADLLANSGFWRRLAETHNADLVLSGVARYEVSDRSGFVQQDEISPLTGQRVRRTRYIEREGFTLELGLFFIRGRTGKLVFEDQFDSDRTVNGGGADRLTVLYNLFEQFESDLIGIVMPKTKPEQRYLFTE